jgi:hypothetical protein
MALERDRLRGDADLRARTTGLGREGRLEPRAVENVTHVTFGDADLSAIRRPEDHARDATRDPARALRRYELAQPPTPDALTATHRRADRPVALHEHDVEVRVSRLTGGDESGRSATDDHDIGLADGHAGSGAATAMGRGIIDSAPTGHGAMHF